MASYDENPLPKLPTEPPKSQPTGMFGKGQVPEQPDYTPLIDILKGISERSEEIAREQLEWAKKTYAENKAITDKVTKGYLDTQQFSLETAKRDRQFYEKNFQPLEEKFARDAASYDTPQRREEEAGRAVAGVKQQFDTARDSAIRSLESYGINPSATRFGALDIGVRVAEAAAKAGTDTEARRRVEDTGRAMTADAINIGRGYPTQVVQSIAAGGQAGGAAVSAANQTAGVGGQLMGTGPQWTGMGVDAVGTWGNVINAGYNNALQRYKLQQEQSSGFGSLFGLIGGIGLKLIGGFEDGGLVEPVGHYEDGGPVPKDSSPSYGAVPDDIPARLTAGEFVIPADTVRWMGEKAVHKMIQKAREEKQEAITITGATPSPVAVQQQALPI